MHGYSEGCALYSKSEFQSLKKVLSSLCWNGAYTIPQKPLYTPTRNYAHPPCTRPVRGSQHFCFKIAPMPMYTPRYAGNTSTCTGTDTQYLLLSLFQVYARFQNNARALVYAQEIEAAILYTRGPIHGLLR